MKLQGALYISLLGVASTAGAQNCVLPIPFQYEFQNRATTTLSAANGTDPCAFSVSLDTGAGPSAAGFLHYRRALPTTSVRYGFRIDTSALSGLNSGAQGFNVFSASSPVVVTGLYPVSKVLRLFLIGQSTQPFLRFIAARSGNQGPTTNTNVAMPLGATTVRVEINVGSGADGFVRYWLNHSYSDPPDGVFDSNGAGLDNAAWVGVIGAEIGVSNASQRFRSDFAGAAVVFDQFESSDDVVFFDDFSSGAQ